MIARLFQKMKILRDIKEVQETVEIFPDDVFLVSYPKSGNTWLRFLFANFLQEEKHKIINFQNIHDYCPEWERFDPKISLLLKPRIFKSHTVLNTHFLKGRVIYIVRDPRDVYISYYHFIKHKFPSSYSFKDFLINYNFAFGTWSNHVQSWNEKIKCKSPNILLIKYENLILDTQTTFSKILDFLEIEIQQKHLLSAIDNSSFDNMRLVEHQYGRKYNNNKSMIFVRKGGHQEWAKYFGKIEYEIFLAKENIDLIRNMGYKIDMA